MCLAPTRPGSGPGPAASRAAPDPVDLGRGALGEGRGAADGPVAAHQLGQQLGRSAAGPGGCGVEGATRPRRAGRAVGHHEHAGRAYAVLRAHRPLRPAPRRAPAPPRRSRTPGSVSGSTPWPRLKMWPGVAAGPGQHVAGLGLDHRPTGPGTWRGRGCPGRPGRGRPAAGPRRGGPASPPRRRRPRRRPCRRAARPVPTPKRMRRHRAMAAASPATTAPGGGQHVARTRPGTSDPAQLSKSWTAAAPAVDLGPAARPRPCRPGGRAGRRTGRGRRA